VGPSYLKSFLLAAPKEKWTIAKEPQEGHKFPEEVWTHVHMPGGGENVSLRFVDDCLCGFYALVSKSSERQMAELSGACTAVGPWR